MTTTAVSLSVNAFRGLRRACSALPVRPYLAAWRGSASLVRPFLFLRREMEVVLRQAAVAQEYLRKHPAKAEEVRRLRPEWNLADLPLRELPKRMTAHFSEMIAEILIFDTVVRIDEKGEKIAGFPSFPCIQTSNLPLARSLLERKTAILALSGHLGNFEIISAFYSQSGAPIWTVGREANYPVAQAFIEEVRHQYGAKNISRGGSSSVSGLRRAVVENQILAVLIDQDTNLTSAFIPFFGIEAATPISAIALAVRHSLPVTTTFAVRTDRMQHSIFTDEISYDPAAPDAVERIAELYSKRLEIFVAAYPEQWPWWHRRWRRRPGIDYRRNPKALRGTRDYLSWLGTE